MAKLSNKKMENIKNKLFTNLDDLILSYKKRGQEISMLINRAKMLEDRVAKLELQGNKA